MATYYTLLTKIGQARIANAVALNQMVNLTYMAVGDGNGNPTTPNENQTALVREKYRATINQLTVDADNPNYLVAELIVPTNVGGWSIYEVGVFDDQNQLIAVANFPATYKPELAEGSGRDLIVRIIIQVSNTSVVTLKIDPAITLASQAWVAANYVKKVTVAGGTTGQILAKKSNANEDFKWVDPTAAVDVNVFSREETQTVSSGQTIVDLAQLTTDGAAIYIEGIRLRDDQFTVNSQTRLTLATSYPAGTKVTIVQNEETSRNAFMLKANNLSDLTDKAAALVNLGLGDGIGRLTGVKEITVSGTYTPTPGTKRAIVDMIGGGGGGGSNATTVSPGYAAAANGGNSGSRVVLLSTINDQATYEVVIGSAGAGGAVNTASGSDGSSGGDTKFGGFIATGGRGGSRGTAFNVLPTAGASNAPNPENTTPTGGDLVLVQHRGHTGDGGFLFSPDNARGGKGGEGEYGNAGVAIALSAGVNASPGNNASGFGSGGSGSVSVTGTGTTGVSMKGGNGSPGVVIIWEYA